jgi:hypothetical protein
LVLPRFSPALSRPALAAGAGIAPAGTLDRVELSPVPWPFGLPPPMPVPDTVLSAGPVPAEPVPVDPADVEPRPAVPAVLVSPGMPGAVPPLVLAASRPWHFRESTWHLLPPLPGRNPP